MQTASAKPATPFISIITPVYRTRPDHLTACVNSVLEQTQSDWQLILVDDASGDPELARMLRSYAADPRIIVSSRAENGGIVAATNDALALASGELVALLDHDDVLARTAVAAVRDRFTANPTAEIFYSDRGHIDADGLKVRGDFWKPDWSPERLRGNMYIAHLTVVSRRAAQDVGGMRSEFEGSQDHDLVLRIMERGHPVVHIPEILYFWRMSEGSTASDPDAKPYARTAGLRAVTEHCRRMGVAASPSESTSPGWYVLNQVPPPNTKVSIIIPTRGTRQRVFGSERCLVVEAVRSIIARGYVADYEIVVVYDVDGAREYLEDLVDVGDGRVRLIPYDEPFNFSRKVNIGALYAVGNVLLLLNDDVEVISPNWLDHMAALALQSDVGAVGAKLLFEDGLVQHAGIRVVPPGGVANAGKGMPNEGGYFGSFRVDHESAAVTGACLAVRTTTFFDLGGFSEEFAGAFNDVDFCFKARAVGYRNVVANSVSLYHFESLTRDPTVTVQEHATLLGRWLHELRSDPFQRVGRHRVGRLHRKLSNSGEPTLLNGHDHATPAASIGDPIVIERDPTREVGSSNDSSSTQQVASAAIRSNYSLGNPCQAP